MFFSTGVKNPVLVADSLLRTQMHGEMTLGRIPPRWRKLMFHRNSSNKIL